ncbi:hypothetical protein chiPu_0005899 [Chiloscyllium punctatum]|uniref:Uncharacterized protein n=1 Tax=Chiloscyllium punctatum TaxID=137246 RepID=A0A401SAP1_CHIPU|nr:hypothetical protein [Chiloscyllium punctatum]
MGPLAYRACNIPLHSMAPCNLTPPVSSLETALANPPSMQEGPESGLQELSYIRLACCRTGKELQFSGIRLTVNEEKPPAEATLEGAPDAFSGSGERASQSMGNREGERKAEDERVTESDSDVKDSRCTRQAEMTPFSDLEQQCVMKRLQI